MLKTFYRERNALSNEKKALLVLVLHSSTSKMGKNWSRIFFKNFILLTKSISLFNVTSVTRLGDILGFGQLFKAFDNN